jgi:hypothetical protein
MPTPRVRLALSLGTACFSLVSAVRDLRTARVNGDKLAVVDGVVSTAAVITGLLLAWRTLRNPEEDVA